MVEPVHELGFALLFQVFQLFQYRARLRLPFTRVKLPRALLRFPATDGHFVLHVSNPFLYHRHLLWQVTTRKRL